MCTQYLDLPAEISADVVAHKVTPTRVIGAHVLALAS